MASLKNTRSTAEPRSVSLYCIRKFTRRSSSSGNAGIWEKEKEEEVKKERMMVNLY